MAHKAERTPSQTSPAMPWDQVACSKEFQDLLAVKKVFIIPAFVFFLVYYFTLPMLVGYAPGLMSLRVVGSVTLGYVYALSQFVVGWIIAWLYLKAASRFDALTKDILDQAREQHGES